MTGTVAGLQPLSLAAVAASPGRARRYVRDSVVSLGHPELVDAVVLAASELATNAYLHARTRFVVSVGETAHGTIRLGVSDSGATSPVQRDADLWASQGRGLRLLDATGEWGVDWNADGTAGKTVWFEPAPAV
jgi:anti-sigma regulatory factor (Ser/Thr protein kinase)